MITWTWDSVRIALTHASFNKLKLKVTAADIQSTYSYAPLLEKHYVICNDDVVIENREKFFLISCSVLYGGKIKGHDYWVYMGKYIKESGYISCQRDPDIWKQMTKKVDGLKYWEYLLLYTNDCVVISPNDREDWILYNEIHPKKYVV